MCLCQIKNHTIKIIWGMKAQFQAFLIVALDEGKWSASCPGRFTTGENSSILTGWEFSGSQSQCGRCGENKKLCFGGKQNLDFPVLLDIT
jgi:hypothetical protein